MQKIRERLMRKTVEEVRQNLEKGEEGLVRAVQLIEDLDKIFNLLYENVREWYALHFPELSTVVKDPKAYLGLVSEVTLRERFTATEISKHYGNEERALVIAERAKYSIGAHMSEEEACLIKDAARLALELKAYREKLAKHIESEMLARFPNFATLAGPMLAAKILATAGSVEELVKAPASRIQLIGAEKALFKHLKYGSKAPKHGLILQHPLVRKAKKKHRGKVARMLANKLAIALREDYFGKRDIASELHKELKAKLAKLR
jgi:nucleolar protein 56